MVYKVLIAEDELWIRNALIEMVERIDGFMVAADASDGEEAWRLLNEYWPNVVITDIMMPKKDGLWLVKQIHDHLLPVIPVIISGYDNFTYAKQAIHYGVAEYLLKPAVEDELRAALIKSVSKLENMAELHESVQRIQQFIEMLTELEPAKLLREQAVVTSDILHMKVTNPAVRTSLLRILAVKMNEFLAGAGADPLPFTPTESDAELQKHIARQTEEWIKYDSERNKGSVSSAVKRACDYIHAHFSEDLTLPFMAEMSHMSISYFSATFKKGTGQTFVNYLNQIRLERAKEMLLQPELKIYEVADSVGFTSLPYFNRLFKQAEGVSPNEFRKRMGI